MILVKVNYSDDWSAPEKVFRCPICDTRIGFYSLIKENKCKLCHGVMPDIPAMVKKSTPHIMAFHFGEKYKDEL